MTYKIKEIFYTLQGEGARSGRASVFCRFTGCNLWTGREKNRQNAICKFCDTDFVGTDGANGGSYTSLDLANLIANIWHENNQNNESKIYKNVKPYVVLTGGEPLLQIDDEILQALHNLDFEIAVESNGTQKASNLIDWLTISPKNGSNLVIKAGQELKLVYPQNWSEEEIYFFTTLDFANFYLQPMYGINYQQNLKECIEFCKKNPIWRLSLQTHKIIGIE